MIVAETAHPLRTACNNCPEPEGGRGTLRTDGYQDVLTCAICHTLHSITPHVETARPSPMTPVTLCPRCHARLRLHPGEPCSICGLAGSAFAVVEQVRRSYIEAITAFTAAHQAALDRIVAD